MSSPQSPIIHDSSGSSGSQDIAHADLRHTELDNSGNWQYKKLDTSKSEIRLLRLPSNCQSGEAQSFKCVIDHFSLVGPPAYTALSYPWGDQHDKLPILINYDVDHTGESLGYSKTHVLRVGRNLYNALSNLAYLGYERVWADALCINQQDVEERSQQILRMDAIYRSARDVVVCLPDTGRLETHTLPLFSEMWEYESAIRLLERRSLTGDIESSQDPDEHVKLSDLIARYREPWKKNLRAIYQFFTHQYWARVWILQELAFGVKVDIVCGSQRIPFACVEKAIDIVQRLAFLKNVSGIQQVNTIIEIRAQVRSADPLRLLDILQRSYKSQSSNMLDRVYGVYGLLVAKLVRTESMERRSTKTTFFAASINSRTISTTIFQLE
ncbi:uncharacterized protein KY384_009203 [Bacidia gigantensis]|uniref:uncharacterized protein n=1 Tax=Bacidia gigantensis TaxID=2732470 RepID=UPI001D058856|nr:uncharacterized protein KY384_009203 [Bacidia gigantensis]KAG8525559.1 hypothetical protein KY384_009203 [Bacidia gigantensis]